MIFDRGRDMLRIYAGRTTHGILAPEAVPAEERRGVGERVHRSGEGHQVRARVAPRSAASIWRAASTRQPRPRSARRCSSTACSSSGPVRNSRGRAGGDRRHSVPFTRTRLRQAMAGHPEVFVIHAHKDSKVANGEFWHSDVSCDEEPPLGTILQIPRPARRLAATRCSQTCPPRGDALSEPMKKTAQRADRAARVRAHLPRPLRGPRRRRRREEIPLGRASSHPHASRDQPSRDVLSTGRSRRASTS